MGISSSSSDCQMCFSTKPLDHDCTELENFRNQKLVALSIKILFISTCDSHGNGVIYIIIYI